MHPIVWTLVTIASLGLLFGIGILVHNLILSFKKTLKRVSYSKETWLILLTLLSCFLALSYKNFFYGFPAVPILIAAFTVILLARKLTIASVIKKHRWISILIAIIWGIWSFCIYFLLQTAIMPDYPTLHQLREHELSAHGAMIVGIAVWVMILTTATCLYTAIKKTSKPKKEE